MVMMCADGCPWTQVDERFRALNPRVRGSSPWRRTRCDLVFSSFPSSAGRAGIGRGWPGYGAGVSAGRWYPRLGFSVVGDRSRAGSRGLESWRARIAGHSSTGTTEVVYRREVRLVLTGGAPTLDRLLG